MRFLFIYFCFSEESEQTKSGKFMDILFSQQAGELEPYLWSVEPGAFSQSADIYCHPAAGGWALKYSRL